MNSASRLLKWPKRLFVILVILLAPLQNAVRVHSVGRGEDSLQVSSPVEAVKVVNALRGATRQADRIVDAIESGEINLEVLRASPFYKRYRGLGGERTPESVSRLGLGDRGDVA